MTPAQRGLAGEAATLVGRPRRSTIVMLLLGVFALRLTFGLVSDFWGEDEFQIYLIGLKYYTTGVWPLYGPDVVYTQTQVPGGLQGLLVGGPLWLVPQPESPYVLLNLLTLAALTLLGWYIGRRVPDVPRWFLWSVMFFSPWTLDVTTHVINTSYVIVGAVIFCVGAFELMPATRLGAFSRSAAFFGLGFGALWVYQFHLSAALFAPMTLAVFVLVAREDPGTAARGVGWRLLGAAVAGSTVLPTLVAVGPAGVVSRTGANMAFEPGHLLRLPQVVLQFLSFATFELPRFLGSSTSDRLAFLTRFVWAAPFVVFAALCGFAQTAALAAGLFSKEGGRRDWPAVRLAALSVLALVFLSFALSIKAPASHAFYLVMPVAMVYAFCRWSVLLRSRAVRVVAMLLMSAGAVAHAAIAVRNFADRSLYRNRPLVVRAIQEKDYRLLGERRADVWERDAGTAGQGTR